MDAVEPNPPIAVVPQGRAACPPEARKYVLVAAILAS
jgi:hypothetical protein